MNDQSPAASASIHVELENLLPSLSELYMDLHAHPELSMQETRTAGVAANYLRQAGYEVTSGVGKTGVVGVLKNGPGPVVMLRADMDALPIKEETGLAYASQVMAIDSSGNSVPVMHACGHDMHTTCLLGAADLLAKMRQDWKGTLVMVFQPAEETSEGARAMIADGLFNRFPKPDVILGQHVVNKPAGSINCPRGAATSTGDSLKIRMIGRGSHGAMPENSIDPVVMAASTVMRLQTIVSRETTPAEAVILTIGSLQAGTKENIIPDEAILKVNVRTYAEKIRQQVLAAIERIVKAEAQASGAITPPEITTINHFSLVRNDSDATQKALDAFRRHFPPDQVQEGKPTQMSDDFGEFSDHSGAPAVFWFIGSSDPDAYAKCAAENRLADLPTNHNSKFAPLVRPTIELGVQTLTVGALAWLS